MSYRNLIVAAREMTPSQRLHLREARARHQKTADYFSKIVSDTENGTVEWDPVEFFNAVAMMDGAQKTVQRLDQYLDERDPTLNTTHHQDTP